MLRKTAAILLILTMLFIFSLPLYAAEPTTTLTGASTVRAGDTLTLTYRVNGTGITALKGKITYNKSQLTFSSSAASITNWDVEVKDDKNGTVDYMCFESFGKNAPINSSAAVFKVTFKVNSKLTTGTALTVDANTSELSDGNNDYSSVCKYSVSISRPLSTDASLSSMSIDGFEFNEPFSADVYDYTIKGTVPFANSGLKINVTPSDSKADVDISGADRLNVGENTAKITVTSESGNEKKVYTVKFTREQDPDYVPSGEARLSEITLSSGILSPSFNPDIYKYIVYLPYEVTSVTVSATAIDALAKAPETQTTELKGGENTVTLSSTAENGSVLVYTLTVIRMPEYTDETGEASQTDTSEQTTEIPGDSDTTTEGITETDAPVVTQQETSQPETTDTDRVNPPAQSQQSEQEGIYKPVPVWKVLAYSMLALLVGGIGGAVIFKSK